MNVKRNLSKALLLTCLASSALPALAVTYDSAWYASRRSPYGVTYQPMATSGDHFCFLSSVGMEEIDVSEEYAKCDIYSNGYTWVLTAYIEGGSDAYVYCKAYCYNN